MISLYGLDHAVFVKALFVRTEPEAFYVCVFCVIVFFCVFLRVFLFFRPEVVFALEEPLRRQLKSAWI